MLTSADYGLYRTAAHYNAQRCGILLHYYYRYFCGLLHVLN